MKNILGNKGGSALAMVLYKNIIKTLDTIIIIIISIGKGGFRFSFRSLW